MSAPESFKNLIGSWSGTNRLWLSPKDPVRGTDSTAAVALIAQGKFITIAYTWSFEGKPQEGLLLVGCEKDQSAVEAVWFDSWHMSDKFMVCEGDVGHKGVISIRGSYSAPPGPDWGWRTVIDPKDGSSFQIIMYNMTPDGAEELAVEVTYTRPR